MTCLFLRSSLAVKTHNEVTLFTAIFSLPKRSEQILIKFAILLQVRLTHAQTFFRGVCGTNQQMGNLLRMRQISIET
jgi:hypothetical protein